MNHTEFYPYTRIESTSFVFSELEDIFFHEHGAIRVSDPVPTPSSLWLEAPRRYRFETPWRKCDHLKVSIYLHKIKPGDIRWEAILALGTDKADKGMIRTGAEWRHFCDRHEKDDHPLVAAVRDAGQFFHEHPFCITWGLPSFQPYKVTTTEFLMFKEILNYLPSSMYLYLSGPGQFKVHMKGYPPPLNLTWDRTEDTFYAFVSQDRVDYIGKYHTWHPPCVEMNTWIEGNRDAILTALKTT